MNLNLNKHNFRLMHEPIYCKIINGVFYLNYQFALCELSLFTSGSYDVVLIGAVDMRFGDFSNQTFVCMINNMAYYLSLLHIVNIATGYCYLCDVQEIDCDDLNYINSFIGGL